MRVGELIDLLPDIPHEYRGALDVPFTGMAPRLPTKLPSGRFAIIRDESWPPQIAVDDGPLPGRNVSERRVERAFSAGASGVICSSKFLGTPALEGRNAFFSTDTYALARNIAKVVRANLKHQRITAVTGSAGKTTVRAMLVHALRACNAGRVSFTPGNSNLYRSVLGRVSQAHWYDHTVIEASSAAFLVFREHDFSVSPDVSIITSLAEAHLDYMGTLENLADVKSDIFQLPPPGGTAIINRDTLRADLLIERAVAEGCQLVTYGESPAATVRLVDWEPATRRVVAMAGQERIDYVVGSDGKHTAINSLAVIAALRAHRIENWREGVAALRELQPRGGRGKVTPVRLPNGKGITLIDEAYNANTASVRTSVASLSVMSVPNGGRRIAVLGDIGELGTQAEELHRSLATDIVEANPDQVLLFGQHMFHLYLALRDHAVNVRYWHSLDDLRIDLPNLLQSGDAVLMKASGTMGLQGLVKEMTAAQD